MGVATLQRAQIWILIYLLQAGAAFAQQGSESLSFRVVENVGADTTISEICCASLSYWQGSTLVNSIQTGYGGQPIWIKIEGITDGGLLQFRPILDQVTLYTRETPDSDWKMAVTGDIVSNDLKVFETPFMAIPLPAQLDREDVYARITMPVAVSISVRQWALPAFIAMQNDDRVLKTFLLGFIIAIMLYNVVVSFLVRDPVFLVNALCIGSLLVMTLYLSGYGAAYFWAQFPQISNIVFSGSVMSAVVFGGLFVFLFLRDAAKPMRSIRLLLAAPVVAVTAILTVAVTGSPYWIAQGAMLGCAALLCTTLFLLLVIGAGRGDTRARLLAIPFLAAVIPGVLLVSLQKIAGINPLNIGNNTMEVALALEAMLFSLALASRVRAAENASRETARELLSERERSSALALTAQDNERKRLSRELHDGVGQEMLLIVSRLKRLAKGMPDEKARGTINQLVDATSGMMSNLRRISRDMHPASIEHLGLTGTIEEITHQLNESGQIEFDHELHLGGHEIGQDTQLQIVRIVQECLANVVKHSGATKCITAMHAQNGMLKISIEDDGIGIDQSALRNRARFGLGLTSIDERVRSLGGNWHMGSSRFGGLATIISIPATALDAIAEKGRW